jgi:predicted transcriptional regulator
MLKHTAVMTNNNNKEVWVFLSHSNKDYEKVRQVRNMLEEQSLRPLMFFLHCLSDDEEIDSLIKREIDCRTRFILCDSENARKSHWVQKEVEYIKSQNRICETIDLSKSMDEILSTLQDFINKTRIFISYNREEYLLAEMIYNRLRLYDFAVYMDMIYIPNHAYTQDYGEIIHEIKHNAETGGYVVSIANERVLTKYSDSRYELIKAIKDNHDAGHVVPNIIPFVMQNSVIGGIKNDVDLLPLLNCNIQSLEGLGRERQCDEIVKRVVMQLMTPGSIKVLADNLAKGTFHETNKKEAAFLYELIIGKTR